MARACALVNAVVVIDFPLNKKASNTAYAGLTLLWYSLKNDFRLYFQSIERRSSGVQINKRPVTSRAFVFLNRILSALNVIRKKTLLRV